MASAFIIVLFVSIVCPVAIRAMVFCTVCRWVKFVSDRIGDHVVDAYSMIGLVIVLYVLMRVSLDFPHDVPESALYILTLSRFAYFCIDDPLYIIF